MTNKSRQKSRRTRRLDLQVPWGRNSDLPSGGAELAGKPLEPFDFVLERIGVRFAHHSERFRLIQTVQSLKHLFELAERLSSLLEHFCRRVDDFFDPLVKSPHQVRL